MADAAHSKLRISRQGMALALAFLATYVRGDGDLPPWGLASRPAPTPNCNEISTSLGSHMVLQRAPESAVVYGSVCGKLAGATEVSVSIDDGPPTSAVITSGSTSWTVSLPPQPGGLTPHTVSVWGGSLNVTLVDVLFGDVILCSGQVKVARASLHCILSAGLSNPLVSVCPYIPTISARPCHRQMRNPLYACVHSPTCASLPTR